MPPITRTVGFFVDVDGNPLRSSVRAVAYVRLWRTARFRWNWQVYTLRRRVSGVIALEWVVASGRAPLRAQASLIARQHVVRFSFPIYKESTDVG